MNPREPFAALPPELHGLAQQMVSQGHSAEGACRQGYDNWIDSLIRDFQQSQDGINPDRDIKYEDWTQLDPAHDKPTSYMHHAFRHSDYMEELTRKAWSELGKPYHLSLIHI